MQILYKCLYTYLHLSLLTMRSKHIAYYKVYNYYRVKE